MEYLLILILQLLGIGFHVMQKIISIGNDHPDKNLTHIFSVFLYKDWDTLFVSGLIIILNFVTHYIVENYAPALREIKHYHLYSFAMSLVLGYAGQRLIYKFLGSAEGFLDKKMSDTKVEEKLKS